MRYESLKELSPWEFRRLTGVRSSTFGHMVKILESADAKKSCGGRRNKLCIEDQLLLALEYLREYRTYFHIGVSYGVSESSAYKTSRWVEDTLIKGAFKDEVRQGILFRNIFWSTRWEKVTNI